ncbi:MAG: hypothetical protein RR942_13845 [Romboutsia sp.]
MEIDSSIKELITNKINAYENYKKIKNNYGEKMALGELFGIWNTLAIFTIYSKEINEVYGYIDSYIHDLLK